MRNHFFDDDIDGMGDLMSINMGLTDDEDCSICSIEEKNKMADYDEEEAMGMAGKMGKNASQEDIDNVASKLSGMKKGPIKKIWDKVTKLWEAFLSPNTPAYVKAMIIGGLIYLVSPLDLIPDVIPVLGLTDDVGVIGLVFTQAMRILGKVAIGGAIGAAICATIKLAKLTIRSIRNAIKKYAKEKGKEFISAEVKDKLKNGEFTTVNIGLTDEDGNEEVVAIEGKEVSKEVEKLKEGDELLNDVA